MSLLGDKETAAAVEAVRETYEALTAARAHSSRCRLLDARAAALIALRDAEAAYRVAADRRDQLVEIWRARRMQAGDPAPDGRERGQVFRVEDLEKIRSLDGGS